MQTKTVKRASDATLVRWYEEAAIVHADWRINVRRSDHAADRLAAIYRELRERGVESQRALLPLLKHPHGKRQTMGWRARARVLAAEGVSVFEQLSSQSGLDGFDAEMTLRERRAGRLTFL